MLGDNYYENNVRNCITLGAGDHYLKAKDIKVYLEDGQPYIRWVGEYQCNGDTFEVCIPKLDVNVHAIVKDNVEMTVDNHVNRIPITIRRDMYATEDDVFFTVTRKERKMTKEQIEKELGYKIEIEDE